MAAVSRRTEHTALNRPSISPLSTKTSSPVASRDGALPSIDAGNLDLSRDGAGAEEDEKATAMVRNTDMRDDDDSDHSSSLSEPDDDDDEEDARLLDLKYRALLAAEQQQQQHNTNQSHDVDSEAETERLDQTPTKLRKHADSTGRTPSKLSHAAAVDELSDPPSPLPARANGTSSTSTAETLGKLKEIASRVLKDNTAEGTMAG
jgi:hypothetical protein